MGGRGVEGRGAMKSWLLDMNAEYIKLTIAVVTAYEQANQNSSMQEEGRVQVCACGRDSEVLHPAAYVANGKWEESHSDLGICSGSMIQHLAPKPTSIWEALTGLR